MKSIFKIYKAFKEGHKFEDLSVSATKSYKKEMASFKHPSEFVGNNKIIQEMIEKNMKIFKKNGIK